MSFHDVVNLICEAIDRAEAERARPQDVAPGPKTPPCPPSGPGNGNSEGGSRDVPEPWWHESVEEWEARERIADTIDALTRANGLLSRNYLEATANLTAVQARCTAQELELRVLRRAFALATGNAAPGYYLEQAREELAR